jgi:hypothetical protein
MSSIERDITATSTWQGGPRARGQPTAKASSASIVATTTSLATSPIALSKLLCRLQARISAYPSTRNKLERMACQYKGLAIGRNAIGRVQTNKAVFPTNLERNLSDRRALAPLKESAYMDNAGMRGRSIAPLVLNQQERSYMERQVRPHSAARSLSERCRTILRCADGLASKSVAAELGLH